jgi:Cu2+-containing amine oxidase
MLPLAGLLFASIALAFAASAADSRHPLDGLTADESRPPSPCSATTRRSTTTRAIPTLLEEPAKERVLAWKGEALPRRAFLVVKKGAHTFEAVVDVGAKKIDAWREKKGGCSRASSWKSSSASLRS